MSRYAMFGKLLRAKRDLLGLTREELAAQLGLSPATLGNCEDGRQRLGRPAEILLDTIYRQAAEAAGGQPLAPCAGEAVSPTGAPADLPTGALPAPGGQP